jgi:hypothetical protein
MGREDWQLFGILLLSPSRACARADAQPPHGRFAAEIVPLIGAHDAGSNDEIGLIRGIVMLRRGASGAVVTMQALQAQPSL